MLSIKTKRRLAEFAWVLGAFLAIVGVFALFSLSKYASYADSYLWSLWHVPALLGLWVALEWSGTFLLDRPFWNNMSSPVRVILLVALICLIVVAYLYFVEGIRLP